MKGTRSGIGLGALALLMVAAGCGDISVESAGAAPGWTDTAGASDGFGAWDSGQQAPHADAGPTPGGGQPGDGSCVPVCDGKQCGPDGCGGSCGWCSGNDSCQDGVCVLVAGCVPACAGKMIGLEDGCGGVCAGSGMGIGLAPGGAQDAAYFRALVQQGQVPSPDVLPIEGWLTEHGTSLPPPQTDRFVSLHGFLGLFYDPADAAPTVALQLGMNSAVPPEAIEAGRFNLCVVVDKSGSMHGDKMEMTRAGLLQMLDALDEDDYLSIVTYDDTAQLALPPQKLTDKAKATAVIQGIMAGGSTNIHQGLSLGYEQVMKHIADQGAMPRVMLVSDGVATAGIMETPAILAMSGSYNAEGIGLTTIGVGQDFNFELMHLLATQGLGNFYFIESGAKLAQVFTEEIHYLLTPVANNLRLWFRLPDGFGVEDVYGFEYAEEDGEFHLLGPKPQYTVEPGGTPTDPGQGGGETPQVAVSTLFASKKNGLVMVKVATPGVGPVKALEGLHFASLHYAYDLVETGETESFDLDVPLGAMDFDADGGFSHFSGAIMQRNFCVLRAGLAMKEAARLFHEAPDQAASRSAAIAQLATATTLCEGINLVVNDPRLTEDVALMAQLMDNVCGDDCLPQP